MCGKPQDFLFCFTELCDAPRQQGEGRGNGDVEGSEREAGRHRHQVSGLPTIHYPKFPQWKGGRLAISRTVPDNQCPLRVSIHTESKENPQRIQSVITVQIDLSMTQFS